MESQILITAYQYGNSFLPVATSFRDLGVICSNDDTRKELISKVAQRGRQLIGHCFRAFQSRDPRFLVLVYHTYVLLILNYGSPVWSLHLHQEVNELESVQRRFTRHLTGLRGYSYGERLWNLSLLSLKFQYQMADYLTIYKIIHKQMSILYKTQDLISQLAILKGVVSRCFNIVPLLSLRRLTLNSEQRRCGTRSQPICYNYRNCHSLSLLSEINC